MARTTQFKAWWLCVAVLGGAGGIVHAQEPEDPRVQKVFADWQKRSERVKVVRYTAEGERFRPKASAADPLTIRNRQAAKPTRDLTNPVKYVLLLDFAANRHRMETDNWVYHTDADELRPAFYTATFDGTLGAGRARDPKGDPPPRDIKIGIGEPHPKGTSFDTAHWPMFVGHGVICVNDQRVNTGKLTLQADPELFYVHGTGVHGGRNCLVLRTRARSSARGTFEELWVDPGRDSAVVRQLAHSGGKIWTDTDIQYRKTEVGWLPERWTYTLWNHWANMIAFQERLQVTELLLEPVVSDPDFRIETPPGALVARFTYKDDTSVPGGVASEQTLYRVQDDGTWQEVVIENGVERKRRRFSPWWGLGLIPLAGGAYLLSRNLRREEARPPAGAQTIP